MSVNMPRPRYQCDSESVLVKQLHQDAWSYTLSPLSLTKWHSLRHRKKIQGQYIAQNHWAHTVVRSGRSQSQRKYIIAKGCGAITDQCHISVALQEERLNSSKVQHKTGRRFKFSTNSRWSLVKQRQSVVDIGWNEIGTQKVFHLLPLSFWNNLPPPHLVRGASPVVHLNSSRSPSCRRSANGNQGGKYHSYPAVTTRRSKWATGFSWEIGKQHEKKPSHSDFPQN